jgi:hypothetical protein
LLALRHGSVLFAPRRRHRTAGSSYHRRLVGSRSATPRAAKPTVGVDPRQGDVMFPCLAMWGRFPTFFYSHRL